jgi:glycosyltransferase involved in cell wall biosynthesis
VPAISIILPVKNGVPFLSSAIDTIMAQNCGDIEVVLIDDGSTDGLAERLNALDDFRAGVRLKYLRQEGRGPGPSRNRGIRESSGEWIAFLDIDDLWTAAHLQTLARSLAENPNAEIAQGMMRQFWQTGVGRYFRTQAYRMPYLGSCLFRRSVFLRCGMFDESMRIGEDYDLMVRCWENDVIKVDVPHLSLLYRRHSNNVSRGDNHAAHLLAVKRRIDRIKAGLFDPAAPRLCAMRDYLGDREPNDRLEATEVTECGLLSA